MAGLYNRYLGTLFGLSLFRLGLCAEPVTPCLHHTSFDGGLHWSEEILRLDIGARTKWIINLRHVTSECKFSNEMASHWELQGLENHLLFDVHEIAWISMHGITANFSKSEIDDYGHSKAENGCELTRASDQSFIVKDIIGNLWFYERGMLTRIEFASGLVILCQCSNGIIEELTTEGKQIFTTHWEGNCLFISSFTGDSIKITYDETKQLIQSAIFYNNEHRDLKFTYEGKLISSIKHGETKIDLTWEKVPTSIFPNRSLGFSYYLKSDGHYTYKHKYQFGDYIVSATDNLGNTELKVLNSRSATVKYYKKYHEK